MNKRVTLKNAHEGVLELHLFMQLSIKKSAQSDLIRNKLEGTHYVALEGAPEISI